jgi:hypothetical protein
MERLTAAADRAYAAVPHDVLIRGFAGPLVYATVARSEGRFRGILNLLADDYQDEALVVLRSLINDAMRVQFLERNPTTREGNALWWWSSQVKELRKYAEAARRSAVEEWEEAAGAASTLHDEIRNRQAALGYRMLPAMPAEGKGMARALGQPRDELDYLISTWSSHSTLLAVLRHHRVGDDSTTTYLIRGSDLARLIEIGRLAADYYTRVLVSAAHILDWATVDELEESRAAIERDLVALEDEVAESQGD